MKYLITKVANFYLELVIMYSFVFNYVKRFINKYTLYKNLVFFI